MEPGPTKYQNGIKRKQAKPYLNYTLTFKKLPLRYGILVSGEVSVAGLLSLTPSLFVSVCL